MSRARRIAHILMLCLIGRHLFANEYGVADRVIEIIIAAVVLAEGVAALLTWRSNRKRKSLISARTSTLRAAMQEGQRLLLCTPSIGKPQIEDWAQAVSNWNEETRVLLRSYSEDAEVAFMTRRPDSPSNYGSIGAVFDYISLRSGLDNLTRIIEKPDVYL
jgi:hypothetical protein